MLPETSRKDFLEPGKLDIGLKRYVNNIFSPLASNIYTTPKVHVYAKLPNKMLGKSEYKIENEK